MYPPFFGTKGSSTKSAYEHMAGQRSPRSGVDFFFAQTTLRACSVATEAFWRTSAVGTVQTMLPVKIVKTPNETFMGKQFEDASRCP